MTEDNHSPENETPLENETISSETAPIPEVTITLGQLIKQKREEKGLSLKVISQQTKIHIGLLESLEADHYEKLPSKTYVRGFIKSTAKILGMDQAQALLLLDKAYETRLPQNVTSLATQKEMKTEAARNTLSSISETPFETVRSMTLSSSAVVAKTVIFIGVFILIAFNVKNFMEKSGSEIESKLPEVISTLDRKKTAPVKILPKPIPVEAKVEAPIEVNLIQDKNPKVDVTVNDVKLQTISLGDKQFVNEEMSKEKMDELFPEKYRVQPTKGTETIFLNATEGDSWLTYKVDDKDIKKFVLRQGRTLFLRGSLIRLFIGNTKTLKVFYNNKAVNLSANAKSGIKHIVLPEELKTKYMAPLFVFLEDGSAVTSDEYLKSNDPRKQIATPAVPSKSTKVAPAPAPTPVPAPVPTPEAKDSTQPPAL